MMAPVGRSLRFTAMVLLVVGLVPLATFSRTASRNVSPPDGRRNGLGFRCARDAPRQQ